VITNEKSAYLLVLWTREVAVGRYQGLSQFVCPAGEGKRPKRYSFTAPQGSVCSPRYRLVVSTERAWPVRLETESVRVATAALWAGGFGTGSAQSCGARWSSASGSAHLANHVPDDVSRSPSPSNGGGGGGGGGGGWGGGGVFRDG